MYLEKYCCIFNLSSFDKPLLSSAVLSKTPLPEFVIPFLTPNLLSGFIVAFGFGNLVNTLFKLLDQLFQSSSFIPNPSLFLKLFNACL